MCTDIVGVFCVTYALFDIYFLSHHWLFQDQLLCEGVQLYTMQDTTNWTKVSDHINSRLGYGLPFAQGSHGANVAPRPMSMPVPLPSGAVPSTAGLDRVDNEQCCRRWIKHADPALVLLQSKDAPWLDEEVRKP